MSGGVGCVWGGGGVCVCPSVLCVALFWYIFCVAPPPPLKKDRPPVMPKTQSKPDLAPESATDHATGENGGWGLWVWRVGLLGVVGWTWLVGGMSGHTCFSC